MTTKNYCPKCGAEIGGDDVDFCTECGHSLSRKALSKGPVSKNNVSKGFFDDLAEKTNFPVIVFSFIIFGIFLLIGSFFWASFAASGSIDFSLYFILNVAFAVFFAGLFVGYSGCKDSSYVLSNFAVFLASVYAVFLTLYGLILTFSMGLLSSLSGAFGRSAASSSEPLAPTSASSGLYQSSVQSSSSSFDPTFIFILIVFILSVIIAAYFGVYLGYLLKENI